MKTDPLIVLAGYRDWASAIFNGLEKDHPNAHFIRVKTSLALSQIGLASDIDAVFLAGWSWKVENSILEKCPVLGLHPSDLPNYAGGSPLQHQIIDGVRQTKMSLFYIVEELDRGAVVQTADLSLEGQIDEIMERLSHSGQELLSWAINNLSSLPEDRVSPANGCTPKIKRRLQPASSRIEKHDVGEMTTEHLYNLIRARGAPYPNVYIEDETGRLYFERVRFE